MSSIRKCNNGSWKQFAWASFPDMHYVTCLCCGWQGQQATHPKSIVAASLHLEFCNHDQHVGSVTKHAGG